MSNCRGQNEEQREDLVHYDFNSVAVMRFCQQSQTWTFEQKCQGLNIKFGYGFAKAPAHLAKLMEKVIILIEITFFEMFYPTINLTLNFQILNGFIMQKQAGSVLFAQPIKKRLFAIIDSHIKNMTSVMEKNASKVISFNEALLEDWSDMLKKMVFLKDVKAKHIKANNAIIVKDKVPVVSAFKIPESKPSINNQYLINIQANSCDLFQLTHFGNKLQASTSKLSFAKGYVRKYSTYNFIDADNAILIGGSRESNPNTKSKQIFTLNVKNSEISKVAELPYGVSSHCSIKIAQTIYIVGGNKDMNIVTKSCLSYNITNKQINKMASLNYPSASHTLVSWKDQFIYKFGGVGSCFGSWDLSPYIQRYKIAANQWQIVNPFLKVQQELLDHYNLFANSLAYATNANSILIFGGFDFTFQGSNKVLEMTIAPSTNENGEPEDYHQITSIGTVDQLEPGGFFQQQPLYLNGQLLAIQTIQSKQKGFSLKTVSFSNKIRYL